MLVAALYLLCVLFPSAAVAFAPGGRAAHCLTDEQLGLTHVHRADVGHQHAAEHSTTHVHGDGAAHRHDGAPNPDGSGNGHDPAACCGLFGVTAMAVDPQLDVGAPPRRSSILPISFDKLTSRVPDRINRPPIIALPM